MKGLDLARQTDLTPAASRYLLRLSHHRLIIPHIMIQFSRFPSLLLSALFTFVFVAGTLLRGNLLAADEKKIEFPAASQHSVVKQRVGLTDVELDYSRPNKNDREIFGGLVPYGKLWRTGANAVTKIKFSHAGNARRQGDPSRRVRTFHDSGSERVDHHPFEGREGAERSRL